MFPAVSVFVPMLTRVGFFSLLVVGLWKMSRLEGLKVFVRRRLTAAVEDIFGHLERTINEYEEELVQRWKPTDAQQQDWSPSLDQEQPEPPRIKEEQEEVWSSQEGEQLEGLEEADITKFPFSPVPVKTEDDEEKPQSSQLHQSQTEDNRDSDRGSEPDRTSGPVRNEQSSDCSEAVMNLSNFQNNNNKSLIFSDCGQFSPNPELRPHTGQKPFSCSICGEMFNQKLRLAHHMVHHTGQKLFSCDQTFTWFHQLKNHTFVSESSRLRQIPTEPPTSSSEPGHVETGADCGGSEPAGSSGPGLDVTASLCSVSEAEVHLSDLGSDKGQKPFSFPESGSSWGEKTHGLVCNKIFSWRRHTRIHTDQKEKETFVCPECGRTFVCKSYLKGHMRIHSGEARNSCSVCGKCFVLRSHLNEHMRSHTGERPFNCQLCEKSFKYSGNLCKHMKVHRRERL